MEQQGMKIHWISGGIPMEEKMERIIKVIGKV
jgi:hypothetical protein